MIMFLMRYNSFLLLLQMATLQPIIPFKSRKRTYYNENKGKINNENENFLNIEAKVDLNNSEEGSSVFCFCIWLL